MKAGVIDIRAQFCKWLQENAPKLKAELLCQYLMIGENFCIKIKVLDKPLFETTDVSTIKKFVKTVTNNKIFYIRNNSIPPLLMLLTATILLFCLCRFHCCSKRIIT